MRKLRYAVVALVLLLAVMPVLAQDATPIAIGDSIDGELTEDALTANYTFTGEAGQVVTITLVSEDFDAFLRLLDAEGQEIETDDDSAGSLNSRIGPFELPASGEYTIIAASLGATSPGAYTLTLNTVETRTIEYSQTVEGQLTTGELATLYTFTGSAGDTITIALNSDDFDSFLRLQDASGSELVTNDDGGGNLNSLIGPFELPQTGSYTITASSLSGDRTGSYTLSLQRVQVTTLAFGDTVEGEIPADGNAYFIFDAEAGQAVNIAVDSGDTIDTTLTLQSPDGWQVAYDDDGGGSIDPAINFAILDTAGTYIVIVRPYSTGLTGSFAITLTASAVPSLDDGPQTITLNEKQNRTLLQFEGEAGDTVRIDIDLTAGNSVPSNIEVVQNGTTLTYISASSVRGLRFDIEIPETGTVNVRMESWDYEGNTFVVTLSQVGTLE